MTREELIDALKRLAHMAETSDRWTDEERLMPATGAADVIYEALDVIEDEPRTEIRVIELIEDVKGFDEPHVQYAIQYRNDHGPWITVPVSRTTDKEKYRRMEVGADE